MERFIARSWYEIFYNLHQDAGQRNVGYIQRIRS